MPKIFLTIFSLMRLSSFGVVYLYFYPALFGLFLAYEEITNLKYVPIFFIGSILVRSAGCIINDFFDKDFDRRVERTKNRPLASKKISSGLALFVLFWFLLASCLILLSLTLSAIIIGVLALFMTILYPLMKRFTYFPQIFLGFTMNLGCLIAYGAIKDDVSLDALLMYLACGFWTFGYDTIYAFMDISDDKKIGVKSSAIFLEHRYYKLWIAIAYVCFVVLYVIANLLSENYTGAFGVVPVLPILLWQAKTLDISNSTNCLVRFKANIYVGLIMALMMMLGVVG